VYEHDYVCAFTYLDVDVSMHVAVHLYPSRSQSCEFGKEKTTPALGHWITKLTFVSLVSATCLRWPDFTRFILYHMISTSHASRGDSMLACAAAKRAMGTRKGEQLT